MSFLHGKSVLITGGTGSFGRRFVETVLAEHAVQRLVVFSRDELKQSEMAERLRDPRLRYFLGDVRDKERLRRAFAGVDFVVHAAALKQVPAAEYNPMEAIKTNVLGASNVIDCAIDAGVTRVVALSTDKAAAPINLYGATKLVSDKLFIAAHSYAGGHNVRFSVVRYGNVIGSRGSVVPLFRRLAATGRLPITDPRMTRFLITLDQGVRFVLRSLERMAGGELYVPKIPAASILDIARAVAPEAAFDQVGIRPGEKLHELMITEDDARLTLEYDDHYVIQPHFEWWSPAAATGGVPVAEGFRYSSETNPWRLGPDQVRALLGSY